MLIMMLYGGTYVMYQTYGACLIDLINKKNIL